MRNSLTLVQQAQAKIDAAMPPDALERISNAKQPLPDTAEPSNGGAANGEHAIKALLVQASEIPIEPVRWLWGGWLAAGKLHVLGGAPGTGKTTIAMSLAATLSAGGAWPDGASSKAGNVVIWSGEDDAGDTLIPRLKLAGADLGRIHFISGILEHGGYRAFDPAQDIEPLRRELGKIGDVRLLIVDPIVSAVAGDSHKATEVRRGLQPLVDLAASMRCALIGITHFSKGTSGRDPIERITGSLSFGALARIVFVAAKRQDAGEDGRMTRMFFRAKSNIDADSGGFEYDLKQGELETHPGIFSSAVVWGDPIEGAARDLLADAETVDDDEGGALDDAKMFLSDLLADGAVSSKTVKADSDGAGHSWATIRRAQKIMGIETMKEGKVWYWSFPGTPTQNVNNGKFQLAQTPLEQVEINRGLSNFNIEQNQYIGDVKPQNSGQVAQTQSMSNLNLKSVNTCNENPDDEIIEVRI